MSGDFTSLTGALGTCQNCCSDGTCTLWIEQPPAGEYGARICSDDHQCQVYTDGESSKIPAEGFRVYVPSETLDNSKTYRKYVLPRNVDTDSPGTPVMESSWYFDFNEMSLSTRIVLSSMAPTSQSHLIKRCMLDTPRSTFLSLKRKLESSPCSWQTTRTLLLPTTPSYPLLRNIILSRSKEKRMKLVANTLKRLVPNRRKKSPSLISRNGWCMHMLQPWHFSPETLSLVKCRLCFELADSSFCRYVP